MTVTVTLKNTTKEDLVLWPYLSLRVLDAKGKDVPRSRFIGRWGVRGTPSILEGIPFKTVKAGKSLTIKFAVSGFMYDADAIKGWKLPKAGDYKLVVRYHYDRAAARKKYGEGAADIDNADKPWNKAVEIDSKEEIKLIVKD
jgi:hypothetical protein